jgi:DNA-binding beta-propeller fold protein YncE
MRKLSSLLFALILLPVSLPAQSPNYHLLKSVTVGGQGGWDYLSLDQKHHRLYLSHSSQVDVFDIERNEVVGHIMNTEGVHGAAFANVGGQSRGFITCGHSASVLMIDPVTLDTLARIPVGKGPDGVVYDPASNHVFVIDAKSSDLTVLTPMGKKVTTIKLPSPPEFGVMDGHGYFYDNLEDASQLVKVDTKTNKIVATWPLAPGEGPTGIAMDAKTGRIFIGCANQKLIVLNAKDGKILATLPIGKRVDAVAFDPEKKLAFSSNGDGTMTVIREVTPEKFEVVQTVATEPGARTIALDPKTHDVYLATSQFGPTPEATKENPRPRPSIIPGTFHVLKYGE